VLHQLQLEGEEFAQRLFSRMREQHLRVWFDKEEMKGGRTVIEQIDRAIQVNDRLLVVLSEPSMQSHWVKNEICRARKVEREENRRVLFPIRLVPVEAIQAWQFLDPRSGEDLAGLLCSYFIPDFSNWKDHDSFESAFARLLKDLRAESAAKG
jgi:hypothetical protein